MITPMPEPMAAPLAVPLTNAELHAMAIDIADHACRCDIESYCFGERAGTINWYDTTATTPDDPELLPAIAQAVRYLEARGLLHRSAVMPHRVCFPASLWIDTPEGAAQ